MRVVLITRRSSIHVYMCTNAVTTSNVFLHSSIAWRVRRPIRLDLTYTTGSLVFLIKRQNKFLAIFHGFNGIHQCEKSHPTPIYHRPSPAAQ